MGGVGVGVGHGNQGVRGLQGAVHYGCASFTPHQAFFPVGPKLSPKAGI